MRSEEEALRAAELEKIRLSVVEMPNSVDAGAALLRGLADQVRINSNNPQALMQLAEEIERSSRLFAAAVASGAGGHADVAEEELAPIGDNHPPLDIIGSAAGESDAGAADHVPFDMTEHDAAMKRAMHRNVRYSPARDEPKKADGGAKPSKPRS